MIPPYLSDLEFITIDFETYYGPKFGLRSRSYTDYITNTQFRVELLTYQRWGRNVKLLYRDGVRAWVDSIDWTKTAVVGHNTPFDAYILKVHYGVMAAYYLDTMAMSRYLMHSAKHGLDDLQENLGIKGPLKRKLKGALKKAFGKHLEDMDDQLRTDYINYALNDTTVTTQAAQIMLPAMPERQLEILDWTVRALIDPKIELDVPKCKAFLENEKERTDALVKASGIDKDTLTSNAKFAALLESQGIEVPKKISNVTGKESLALSLKDIEFKKLFTVPRLRPILEARLTAKSRLNETRAACFLLHASRMNGKLPVGLTAAKAITNRLGGSDKSNMQNLPRSGELRECLRAPKGHVIIAIDLAAIEPGVASWLTGHTERLEVLRRGEDLYNRTASKLYGFPVERKKKVIDENGLEHEPYKMHGHVAKKVELLAQYQGGAGRLHTELALDGVDITFAVVERMVNQWRAENFPLSNFWAVLNGCINEARSESCCVIANHLGFQHETMILPSGSVIRYPHLHYATDPSDGRIQLVYDVQGKDTRIYGGKVLEHSTQAVSCDLICDQLIEIKKEITVASMSHDELICIVPASEAQDAAAWMEQVMTRPPEWAPDLPLAVEYHIAEYYAK